MWTHLHTYKTFQHLVLFYISLQVNKVCVKKMIRLQFVFKSSFMALIHWKDTII